MTAEDKRRTHAPGLRISTRKKIGFAAITCSAILLFAYAGLEIYLRVAFKRIERITGAAEWQVGQYGELTYRWDQYHPRYGWTNVPGYRSDDRIPFRVTINNQGLRGPRDYAPLPPSGVDRIAVLGNSCVFGEEVDDDHTIPHYLEQHLANTEALNFGVHGFGLGQMALRLEEDVFPFHPDHVVILVLLPMDLYRDAMAHYIYQKPVFSAEGGELRISNIPVPEASQQPWLYRHCFVAAWLFARAGQWEMVDDPNTLLEITHAILRRIRAQCDAHGVPVTLVTIITGGTIDEMETDPAERAYLNALNESLQHAPMDVLDQTGFLEQAYAREGAALMAEFGHWSERGNSLIAGQIAKHLAQQRAERPE
jgi:hypothetical protein